MFASKRTSAARTLNQPGGQANRLHASQLGDSPAAGGISSEGTGGSFLTDDTFAPVTEEPANVSFKPSKHETRWRSLSEAMIKNNSWTSIRRLIDRLPKDIEEIYKRLESNISKDEEKLSTDDKKAIYKEFDKTSSTSFGELHAWEVEGLLQLDVFKSALGVDTTNLLTYNRLIKDMINKKAAASTNSNDRNAIYDFEQFATLVYDLLHQRQNLHRPEKQPKLLGQYIPIDPDYSMKQTWDIFIMVLLVYCSFEVPYTMAFSNSDDDVVPRTPFEVPLRRPRAAAPPHRTIPTSHASLPPYAAHVNRPAAAAPDQHHA